MGSFAVFALFACLLCLRATLQVTTMGYLEVRQGGAWEGVLEELLRQLKELGFDTGQIWNIDIHNNGPDEDGIASAHWRGDPVGPDDNHSHIEFELKNDEDGWDAHYSWADERADHYRNHGKRVISITHTMNSGDRGVTAVLIEHR